LAVPNVQWISLQIGHGEELARTGVDIIDPMSNMRDFADTAALVAGLDLVISVDTAVAHLAGALGRPVWVLSRYDACWRWLAGREDTPWYPRMKVFRQTAPGDWTAVVARVAEALGHEVVAGWRPAPEVVAGNACVLMPGHFPVAGRQRAGGNGGVAKVG
jgi:hypothetical protein